MRFIVNIALKTGMIIFLNWLGWLTLMSGGHAAQGTKEIISVAIVSAVIFTVITVLTLLLTLGLAVLLWLVLGWIVLEIMHHLAPGFIALNHGFWLTALAGFLIMLCTLPSARSTQRRSTSTV